MAQSARDKKISDIVRRKTLMASIAKARAPQKGTPAPSSGMAAYTHEKGITAPTASTSPPSSGTAAYKPSFAVNRTGNERAGQTFRTFTRPGKPGITYHEYLVDGKRKVVGVRKAPKKGLEPPMKGL